MGVRLKGVARVIDRQASGHAKVDEEAVAIIEREDDALAAPVDIRELPPSEFSGQVNAFRLNNLRRAIFTATIWQPRTLGRRVVTTV